jgi:hypothetical protein
VCLETAKKGGRVPVEIRCVHYDLAQISRGSCGLLETWRDWPAVCCRSLQLQSRLSVSSPQQETSCAVCLLLQDLVQSCLHGGAVCVLITAGPSKRLFFTTRELPNLHICTRQEFGNLRLCKSFSGEPPFQGSPETTQFRSENTELKTTWSGFLSPS